MSARAAKRVKRTLKARQDAFDSRRNPDTSRKRPGSLNRKKR